MRTYERSWWWVKEKKQMALVLITITMILQFQIEGCVGCVETERMGLLQLKEYLKNVLNVKEESTLESWSNDASKSDCCLWERVNCSDAIGGRGHIVDLSLSQLLPYTYDNHRPPRSLNMYLLHSFPQLKTFNFSWNRFTHLFDPIHGYKSFQRLEKLSTLDFSNNFLNNSVLPFLSEARSLRTLNLSHNSLEGVFPPNELANMTELRVLNLQKNEFTFFSIQGLINLRELEELDLKLNSINDFDAGNGNKSFQRQEKLHTLDLTSNRLNNSFLPFLSTLRSLRTLNLGGNSLEGVFPLNGLTKLRKLEVLGLSYNDIRDFEADDGLRTMKLRTLDLTGNNFSANARLKGLEHLVELEVLNLANNGFNHTRSIQVLKDMPKLQQLDLSDNEFTDLDSLDFVFPSSLQVLNLQENQLSFTPKGYSQICELTNLREMDLSINALTSIPYCLGNLTRLRTLDLSDNQLNGNLSSFVSGLPSTLEYLSLLDNDFNGSFLFNSLVNQTRLTVFKLSSIKQVQAESSWVPLFQLKMLVLQNCSLGSAILGFLVHQRELCFIDLSHNNLSGTFPAWLFQNNTKLETILLNNNSLTEVLLPELVHGLRVLDISSNRIHDSIQEDIGIVFPKLRYMNVSSNRFYGTIPSSIGKMKSLQHLDASRNSLSGQLPKTFLSGCYSLEILMLSNNRLQGKVFPEHANLTGLQWLALDGNNFNGSLGKGLLKPKYLHILDISNNCISGTLPRWIRRMSSSLRYLNMSGNQLKGPFPRQLQVLQQLEVIDISHNSFSGSIARILDFPLLRILRLQSNDFMGSVPNILFKAERLDVLDMRNNNFSGMIMNGKRCNLSVLLLRNNSIQTHFPEKICQVLSKVTLLDLSHNKFKGVIPSCLGSMSFGAESEDLPFDKEFGFTEIRLSKSWKYTSALNLYYRYDGYLTSAIKTVLEFSTKNRYEAYQGAIATIMYGLDLLSNQLSGEIPVEIGDLKNVRALNLSRNRLTGSIPDSISKMENLESLDMSNNKLDGKISPQLAGLDSLEIFNVSYNNLSGEIPIKGHLLTFGETTYIGNPQLCGLPTNKICNSTRVLELGASKLAKEGDGVIDMMWFYYTCGAVYISISLALSMFLYIDSRWSREWFYRIDLFIHHLHRFKSRFFCN